MIAEGIDEARQADRAGKVARILLAAIAANEPATLGTVAKATSRGAPAVSRSVDALVRSGLVEREADPANRRRLALAFPRPGANGCRPRRGAMRRSPRGSSGWRTANSAPSTAPSNFSSGCRARG